MSVLPSHEAIMTQLLETVQYTTAIVLIVSVSMYSTTRGKVSVNLVDHSKSSKIMNS